MNLIETDSLEGDGIILLPKDGLYENVVFWFHGLGDTAHGWADASLIFCPVIY